MAQVRKYSEGEVLPKKKSSAGKITVGTKTLEGDLANERVAEVFKNADYRERNAQSVIQSALADGMHVIFGNDHTHKILDQEGNDVTGTYLKDEMHGKNAKVSDSSLKRNIQATFGSPTHWYRKGMQRVWNMNMSLPEEKATATSDKKTLRTGNNNWFLYNKDKFLEANPFNKDYLQRVREAINYAIDNEPNLADRYNTSNWSTANLDELRGLGDEFAPDKGESVYNGILEKLRNNEEMDDGQMKLLNLIGFFKPGATSTSTGTGNSDSESQSGSVTIPDEFKGWTASSKIVNGQPLYFSKDGAYRANPNLYNGNWDLINIPDWEGSGFKYIYNGDLYKDYSGAIAADDSPFRTYFSYGNLGNYSDYYKNRDDANLGIRFLGDSEWQAAHSTNGKSDPFYTAFDPNNQYLTGLSDYLRSNNIHDVIGYADISNDYSNDSDTKIYEFITPGNFRTLEDGEKPFYISVDSKGNYTTYNDLSQFTKHKVPKQYTPREYSDLFGKNRDRGVFTTLTNPRNSEQKQAIYKDFDGNFYLGHANDNNHYDQIDPERLWKLMEELKSDTFNASTWSKRLEDLKLHTNIFSNNRNYYDLYKWKEGGSIDWNRLAKLQKGGIASAATKVETRGADLDKSHKIDKSDGGLSDAEKLRIGAAITDVLGTGIAFVPGAHVVAGITGAGASLAEARADYIQDGEFGLGDAGRLAINLGLDAATILTPGIGKAAKTANSLKKLKTAAKGITHLLTVAGVGSAVPTFNKLVNGEKLTSDDVVTLAHAFSAAGILGHNVSKRLGNARLAKEQVTDLSKAGKNKSISVEIDGQTKTITAQELQDTVNGKTVNEAKKALANKFGVTEEKSTEIFDKLKLDVEKGSRRMPGFRDENTGKRAWFPRTENTVSFETPKEQSTWELFWNNKAREKGLDSAAERLTIEDFNGAVENVKKAGRTGNRARRILDLTMTRPEKINNRMILEPVRSANAWTLGGRTFYQRPRTLEDIITPSNIKLLPQHSHLSTPVSYKAVGGPKVVIPEEPVHPLGYYNFNDIEWFDNSRRAPFSPYVEDMSLAAARKHYKGEELIGYTPPKRKANRGSFKKKDNTLIPEELTQEEIAALVQNMRARTARIGNSTALTYFNNPRINDRFTLLLDSPRGKMVRITPYTLPSSGKTIITPEPIYPNININALGFLKKGGKIAKAYNGLSFEPIKLVYTPYKKEQTFLGRTTPIIKTPELNTPTYNYKDFLNSQNTAKMYLDDTAKLNPLYNWTQVVRPETKSESTGTYTSGNNDDATGKKYQINKANLLDAADVAYRIHEQRLATKEKDKAYRGLDNRQIIYTPREQLREDYSTFAHQENALRNGFAQIRPNHSDNFANMAERLAGFEILANGLSQNNVAMTNEKNRINGVNLGISHQNTEGLDAVANEYSSWRIGNKFQRDMLIPEERESISANITGPLSQQFRQQERDAQNGSLTNVFAQEENNLKYRATVMQEQVKQKYRDMAAKEGKTLDAYLAANPTVMEEYLKELDINSDNTLGTWYRDDFLPAKIDLEERKRRAKTGLVYTAKSGGKTRSVTEQIAIDTNRNAQKAVLKMSDNLAKLLQQALKSKK